MSFRLLWGWSDCHLHAFTIGKKCYTESPKLKEDGLISGKYQLGDLIRQKGCTFSYLYDFLDGWEHELILENSHCFNHELNSKLFCLEGERACPPEDVGGVLWLF